MSNACVLLTTSSVRDSATGRSYLCGFLGRSRVVAFKGQADKSAIRPGTSSWPSQILAMARQPPASARQAVARHSAVTDTPAGAGSRPGASDRAPRPTTPERGRSRRGGDRPEYDGEELDDVSF